jgi:hypothetical protein
MEVFGNCGANHMTGGNKKGITLVGGFRKLWSKSYEGAHNNGRVLVVAK